MLKALIKTAVLVGAVLALAQFVPLVAAHKTLALALAVFIGLAGIVMRLAFVLLLAAAAVALYLFIF